MEQLKPCPFCGGAGKVKSTRQPTNGGKSFMRGWVGCPECHCFMNWAHDPHATIARWNRRPDNGE